MNVKISKDLPAGNVRVVSIQGNRIELDVELRDTDGDWFYWCFKAEFPAAGRYEFHFPSANRVGTQGPAVSFDNGVSWQWNGAEKRLSGQDFVFDCDGIRKTVYFCLGMQYLQSDLERFLAEFKGNPFLSVSELCRSKKGRSVELLSVREGNPKHTLLLTSRHHSCEMMATHAMEGILRYALAHPEFRKEVAIYAVPFMDKDGVEDGDQGKNRHPHDYARDYGPAALYPEVRAAMHLIETVKPEMVLDLHCPWIYNGCNEYLEIPGPKSARMVQAMNEWGALLQEEAPPTVPYYTKDNILFGTDWNTGGNYSQGKTIKLWSEDHPFVRNTQTLEIPYANAREHILTHDSMMDLGAAIARASLRYLCKDCFGN